ncbi:MAG: hypothetical protein ISN28_05665 [Ectothiorhodospiraceae bacterium AqS1]|nr:hypothetical protein [Ectothiorhodospiraceae bacterium AqS1]
MFGSGCSLFEGDIDEMIEKDWRETDRTYGAWPGIVGFAVAAGVIASMFALATGFA